MPYCTAYHPRNAKELFRDTTFLRSLVQPVGNFLLSVSGPLVSCNGRDFNLHYRDYFTKQDPQNSPHGLPTRRSLSKGIRPFHPTHTRRHGEGVFTLAGLFVLRGEGRAGAKVSETSGR